MSAIFGIISKNQQPIQQPWIASMLDQLRHRGPDGAHVWQEESVMVGHLMLHITPESCFEKQPLEYQHWVITADVRLDNRKELFALLEISPSLQPQVTDSLLIAKSFEKWGKRCPEFLVGDFSFAIWDKIKRSLYCSRDHAGVRQLFYYDSPNYFVFATEIRAIANLDFITPELDMETFANYLTGIFTIGDRASYTFLKDIRRLMPAHWLNLKDKALLTELYWQRNPDYYLKFKDEREYGLALRELIDRAIEDRLRTDFPVGAQLSGGLDSSSVVCVAARSLAQKGRSLYTASSVLPLNHKGVEEDERRYVDLVVAQEKNIIPKFVSAEGVGAFDNLPAVFDRTCEPVNHFIYMDEALNQSLAPHTRIVLTGFLGDWTVSNVGNLFFLPLIKRLRINTIASLLQSRKQITHRKYSSLLQKHVLMPLIPYDVLELIKYIKGTSTRQPFKMSDCAVNSSFVSEESAKSKHKVMDRAIRADKTHFTDIWDLDLLALAFPSDRDLFSHYQQEHTHPFADKRIIEFLWASPPEYFTYQGYPRGNIRRAMEDILPKEILWRTDKTVFSPDFQARVSNEIPQLTTFLEREINGKFSHYLNIPHIIKTLQTIKPARNWADTSEEAVYVVHTGIQAINYLYWFEKYLVR